MEPTKELPDDGLLKLNDSILEQAGEIITPPPTHTYEVMVYYKQVYRGAELSAELDLRGANRKKPHETNTAFALGIKAMVEKDLGAAPRVREKVVPSVYRMCWLAYYSASRNNQNVGSCILVGRRARRLA